MIEFARESYLFCIFAGLIAWLAFLLLAVFVLSLTRKLKINDLIKKRKFIFIAVVGAIVFLPPSILLWRIYSFSSYYLSDSIISRKNIEPVVESDLDLCSRNILQIGYCLNGYALLHNGRYPDPNWWCDLLIAEAVELAGSDDPVITPKDFICPSAVWGDCHYAMNPGCQPQSSGDTVLLFESDAGWNKYGTAELMAFDHHEPNGCHVIFNDGTVEFITPEKAAALKW